MTLRRAHLRIHGTVQGVSFRAYAREQARRLTLKGWVRNLPDGDVEAIAEGPPAEVEAFLAWCEKGPPEAEVESVTLSDPEPATGEFSSFEIRH